MKRGGTDSNRQGELIGWTVVVFRWFEPGFLWVGRGEFAQAKILAVFNHFATENSESPNGMKQYHAFHECFARNLFIAFQLPSFLCAQLFLEPRVKWCWGKCKVCQEKISFGGALARAASLDAAM